jgi:hypothetical protein
LEVANAYGRNMCPFSGHCFVPMLMQEAANLPRATADVSRLTAARLRLLRIMEGKRKERK